MGWKSLGNLGSSPNGLMIHSRHGTLIVVGRDPIEWKSNFAAEVSELCLSVCLNVNIEAG